jgi:hypothetical protein
MGRPYAFADVDKLLADFEKDVRPTRPNWASQVGCSYHQTVRHIGLAIAVGTFTPRVSRANCHDDASTDGLRESLHGAHGWRTVPARKSSDDALGCPHAARNFLLRELGACARSNQLSGEREFVGHFIVGGTGLSVCQQFAFQSLHFVQLFVVEFESSSEFRLIPRGVGGERAGARFAWGAWQYH